MITKKQEKAENRNNTRISKVEEKRNLDMSKSGTVRGMIGRNLFDGKQQKKQKR